MPKKIEEDLNVVKLKPIVTYLKEKSGKDIQGSSEGASELQYYINKIFAELVDKTVKNTKFRGGHRIMDKDVKKAYEEMFDK